MQYGKNPDDLKDADFDFLF